MQFEPHDYQRYCIERAITDKQLGLLLDMGLGKTVITLTAIMELKYNRFEVDKVLVIAPKKVAEDTWTREAVKWDHLKLLRVSKVLGSQQQRIRALNTAADVYVINRENTEWLVDYYRNSWPFSMVVIDELSSFKNHRAKRFRALKAVRPRIDRIIGLTGTPSSNGLLDLWAQMYLLDEGARLGRSYRQYQDQYFYATAAYGNHVFAYAPRKEAEGEIKAKIADICVSLRAADYLQLPPKLEDTRRVQLDTRAAKQYREMERQLLINVDDKMITAANAAALTNKLLQLCNGAIYDDDHGVAEVHNCKVTAFLELLDGLAGQPALVFYTFRHDRDHLLAALSKTGYRVGELKTPADNDRWNSGQLDILLAHPASAAYGLNLQAGGNHVIWYGLNWSLELYQQANARLHRQGQQHTVYVHHLVTADCMDERVMGALQAKGLVQDALLDALRARIREIKGDGQHG